MHRFRAVFCGSLLLVASCLASTVVLAQGAATVPPALRQLASAGVVQGIDTSATQPRLIAGTRYQNAPRILKTRAKALARSYVRQQRPQATSLVGVDQSGKTLETFIF